VEAVDSLGLANDTIIAVSADHGVSLGSHFGAYRQFLKKGRIEAEMLDVPFVLRYPAKVAPQVVAEVFTSVDIMPTLLGLCKLATPPGSMGRDFSHLLTNGGRPIEPPYGPVPFAESALVGHFGSNWVGIRTVEYTLDCNSHTLQPVKLFRNTTDPCQMTNLVDDAAYAPVRDELHEQLLAWLAYVAPEHLHHRAAGTWPGTDGHNS
jgi:arylsulfatase A-like enzyme